MHKGRQVDKWGDPFTGVCDLVVQNGVISVEGLMSTDFQSEDKQDIEEYIIGLGYDFYMTCHMIKGKRVIVKNWVNELVEA